MPAHRVQRAAGLAEQGAGVHQVGVGRVAGQRGVRQHGGRGERVGVAEPLGLGRQLDLLAGHRLGSGDLLQAEPQQIGLLDPLPGLGGQLGHGLGDLAQPPVTGPVAGQRLGQRLAA